MASNSPNSPSESFLSATEEQEEAAALDEEEEAAAAAERSAAVIAAAVAAHNKPEWSKTTKGYPMLVVGGTNYYYAFLPAYSSTLFEIFIFCPKIQL